MTNEDRLAHHLTTEFGARSLGSFTRDDLQTLLDRKGQTLSFSVVDHLRWDLKQIFDMAVAEGYLQRNPAAWRRSFLPKLKPLGLAWANFQVMRRTHSSLLKELDVDPHVRAAQMGHTIDVNENVYTITSLSRRKDAVNTLEKAIGA